MTHEAPKHRDQRDHHYEDDRGERVHVFGAGAVRSVAERYCAHCKAWIRVSGVLGELRFMAEHDDHGAKLGGLAAIVGTDAVEVG